jgi:PAS domain S-box-containing protein
MNMTADLYADRRDRDNRRQMLKSTGTVSGQDVILKHRDGRGVLVSVTDRAFKDAKGRLRGVEGFFRDITKRRKVEEERTRLATAVEQAHEIVFITDTEGVIQYVNPSFEQVTGYQKEEAIGQKASLLKSGKHDKAFYAGLWATITSGTVWNGRIVNRKKDGTLYEEEATITPIRDHNDRIVSYAAVKRDVSREITLKQQLRQAQKMEAIGTLAGGIAHDFNNILAAIIGYTELVRMDLRETSPLMANINKVLNASQRARDLVAQILAFSRQTEQELKPVSISAIVKEVLKLLRASLPATIEIRQHLHMQPATILADATQIHQVLMNICTNAGHAMRTRGGILEVYLGEARDAFAPPLALQHLTAEDYLCLAVRDTGHGMSPEVLDRIFDPYFTTKQKEEGTGLGLAVAHGIVTSHNGHITVESTPGEGTRFKIYFPLIPDKVSDGKQTMGHQLPGGKERLVLIDDEIDIVLVNRQMLERLGYTVATYTDSRRAVADFEADPSQVDLLITDMTMPGLTGDQVVRAVHARRPDLPVILCTGFSEIITKEKAQDLGVRKLMMKPVSLGELARTIRALLD